MDELDSLDKYILKRKEENTNKQKDWSERKTLYLQSVDDLYMKMYKWLVAFDDKWKIGLPPMRSYSLNEMHLGEYAVKIMYVHVGNNVITIIPKGTMIIGALGQVDLVGTVKTISLVEKYWNEWEMIRNIGSKKTETLTPENFKFAIDELIREKQKEIKGKF